MEYATLNEYTDIAKKTISKFGSKLYPSLMKTLINNEEFVSEVAEAIMMADWKWDPSRTGKVSGKKKTLYSYRNQCAIWAIKTIITKQYRKTKKSSDFLSYIKNQDKEQLICSETPETNASDNEEREKLKSQVSDMINNSPITDKQKNIIQMYYFQDKTFAEIGKSYNVTREAVRQSMKKALEIIKQHAS